MINRKNFFNQLIKNVKRTYGNIRKGGQGDDYTNSRLLDYIYFENCYRMIATDFSKHHDSDPKVNQQINFTGDLDTAGITTFFIIEEAKETILNFSQGTAKVF